MNKLNKDITHLIIEIQKDNKGVGSCSIPYKEFFDTLYNEETSNSMGLLLKAIYENYFKEHKYDTLILEIQSNDSLDESIKTSINSISMKKIDIDNLTENYGMLLEKILNDLYNNLINER